ncbi:30S ribosomal protein S8 [Myxococcota bacterium]|nr:30S ribosomal protein S8 [Myxococcota bacterium]
MMTDPLADMLTRIRNAGTARHTTTSCPASKLRLSIAKLMLDEGFLASADMKEQDGHPVIVLGIRYNSRGLPMVEGIRRVSKPGRRVYVGKREVPKVRNGLGVAVLSTSKGVLSDRAARDASVGGEVLFEVW